MRYYLVGFQSDSTPCVIFYDIKDFSEESIGNFTAISFTEDGINYLYTNRRKDNEFVEFEDRSPNFAFYKYLNEKQAKPFIDAFGGFTTNAEAQASKIK